MSRDVVITGVGAVGPFGAGADALAASWCAGGPSAVEIDRSAGYHRPRGARRVLLAAGVDLSAWLTPALARRMSPPARMAVAAARLALDDAGLGELSRDEHAATALVVGTAFGPSSVTEQLLAQIFGGGPETASPAAFTESVASAPASQLALAIGARGPILALTGREASDLLALADGARLVATGAARRALVIAVDEATPLLHAVLDRFRALARPEADGREVARPFDRRRSGALAAEGAAVLVLERAGDAAARGALPLAALAGAARGFDGSAPPWDWGSGDEGLASVLSASLARDGAGSGVDLVVSGASGAPRGDRLEAAVLRRVFGSALPPVVAPKGCLGGWGGGFLAAAVLAAAGRAGGPSGGFEQQDPRCGVSPAPDVPAAPRRTLVTSLASGGAAAWAVLEGGQPPPPKPV